MNSVFTTVEQAIDDFRQGKMIILMDDKARENEGDLVIAADKVTPEAINFMTKHGRGLICLSMAPHLIEKLGLTMMVSKNQSPFKTAFTQSIEAVEGVSTGISVYDRAHTIKVAIDTNSGPSDIVSPGHIFPLKANPKGVLGRQGQTEGSVDLAKISSLSPAAVICEILNDDGTMSREKDLVEFSKTHDVKILSVNQLIQYRIKHETLVSETASTVIPIANLGEFELKIFSNEIDDKEHFALIKKPIKSNQVPLVRIHSECITGDVFQSEKCDCGNQLQQSLRLINEQGGILIYLRQEGRGIGLTNKIKAYALQEKGYDTVEANVALGLPIDNREYSMAYQILTYLGVDCLRLLTNNPEKMTAISKYGLKVTERISLISQPTIKNSSYIDTKKAKLGHIFN
jgi:3,4-dihydroxy 2-butanone 4-phosphate synthase / GTP cyclohydrolase II